VNNHSLLFLAVGALGLGVSGCSRDASTPPVVHKSTAPLSAPGTFAEVLKATPLVAEVTVVGLEGRDDVTGTSKQPVIVTDLTLQLERSIPKRAETKVVLTQLGGAIGERGMQVSDQPVFVKGERYVVFADPSQKQRPFPMGPAGVLHVVDGRVFGLDGRAVLEVRADGFFFGRSVGVPELVPSTEPVRPALTDVEVMNALEGFAR
jgi:hypothetical protein